MVRLTLRSLLAYIDNLLSPADTAEFEQLLANNENANNLCKRIRSVINKTELGAADILDSSPFADPNMMAEYLDNVLSAESAPDFERTCLTLDRQLAEVAACHQILTVVQVAPANVDIKWRQQVYQLPQFADVASSGDSFVGPPPTPQNEEASSNPMQNLEAYAQMLAPDPEPEPAPSGSRLFYWVAGLILIFVVGWIGLSFLGGSSKRTAQKPAPTTTSESKESQAGTAESTETAAPAKKNANPSEAADSAGAEESKTAKDGTAKTSDEENDEENKDAAKPEAAATADTAAANADTANAAAADTTKDTPETENGSPVISDSAETPETGTATGPATDPKAGTEPGAPDKTAQPVVVNISGSSPAPGETGADGTNVTDSPKTDASAETPGEAKQPAGETPDEEKVVELNAPRVGYLSTNREQFLLQKLLRGDDQQWSRIPEGAGVSSNYDYLALPEFRPELHFGNDVLVTLVGPARLRILSRTQEEPLKLQLDFGKLILITWKKLARPVEITVKGQTRTLGINSPESKLVLETVIGSGIKGVPTSPRENTLFFVYQLRGASELRAPGDNNVLSIPAKSRLDLSDPDLVSETDQEPEWLTPVDLSPAGKQIAKRLPVVEGVTTVLQELYESERKNAPRSIISSLALTGGFKTIIDEFKTADGKRVWDICFDVLQQSALASEDMAEQLNKQLELQLGEPGVKLFDLLWMYQGHLSGEEAAALVESLESDSLPVKIGASRILTSRLKVKSGYRPEDSIEKNQKYIQAFKTKVKSGLPE